tara:strand:+ start:171 stop:407 length:237 start_codon:yes stop_codon:yes gene_type:complete
MKTLELLRIAEVTEECGKVTTRTIYRWMEDGTFHKNIRLGSNSVAWRRCDREAWKNNLQREVDIMINTKKEIESLDIK